MKTMVQNGVRGALTLLVFAVIFTALMAGTYALTKDIVAENERKAKVALIAQVLPAGSFDNDILKDAISQDAAALKQLNAEAGSQIFLAQKDGKTNAVVVETIAPDGYSGKIKLLVGVAADGRVLGVRVVAHKETPGLGDYIDAAKSAWIAQFEGKSLSAPRADEWKVKKDGGQFDYIAGATISPRAVVKAVKNTLDYVAAQHAALFGAAS
ncbi:MULTISPECIES: electron transport complex subunit RsxG [Deefgea]|uniref:Ion-translocating oxidoreductase complex subunit G n=1 Tax=Deefgea chitinilytica TaxID=570276 RepID=A0ABS2CCM6_9NEIS|nr:MULTISPECIES: electron transport complex subunit RsxG [Deefgea]MBM5571904.1 electron transport complex subunit RsxG [Deefgea chitinilytica]MBM9889139.1 electron transport complex subunit RsxG [Deefgea sp. CFH1-16]